MFRARSGEEPGWDHAKRAPLSACGEARGGPPGMKRFSPGPDVGMRALAFSLIGRVREIVLGHRTQAIGPEIRP
jgi:hypothetical protein